MSPALTTEQQDKILAMVKNHYQARERARKLAKSGFVSEARYRENIRQQTERLRDFLKEL